MPEVSSIQAAAILSTSDETIRRYVDRGLLNARQQGLRGIIRIELVDLQKFAEEYGFRYDQALADQYATG